MRLTFPVTFPFPALLIVSLAISISPITAIFAADPAPIAQHNRWVTNLTYSADGNVLVSVGGAG
ncbi:MAG: hypothetical protein ACKPEY_16575, partial [Planctomycetota bacterium]